MGGNILEQVEEEKDLGVLIDAELKFHKQNAAAVKTANSVLGLIKKSFINLDQELLPILYKSLVRPHLEYGNVIWGPFYKDHKSIERVQRRATQLVHNLRNLPYEERLRKLKIPSLEHRRRRGDMIIAYKLFTGNMNIDKCIFFQLSNLTSRGLKIFKQQA